MLGFPGAVDNFGCRASCKASMANSPNNCWDSVTGDMATSNTRLSKHWDIIAKQFLFILVLRATTVVKIGTEISWDDSSYKIHPILYMNML